MKKKIGLFMAFSLVFCCAACSMQNSPSTSNIYHEKSQSSPGLLTLKKAPHTLEVLTGGWTFKELESSWLLPEKEELEHYQDKKQNLPTFSLVRKELAELDYQLEGTKADRKLSYQAEIIATGETIKHFEREKENFVLCAEQKYPEHLRCWTKAGSFDLGYTYEAFPRFFNGELWSVQMIDEDTYGVFKDQELLYQFQATFITFDPILAFEVNEKGWWLNYSKLNPQKETINEILVHNGDNLNQKYRRDQAFALTTIKNQIFYFFQKEATIGYVLDEKTFYLEGEEIAQRRCCSLGAFYPTFYPDFVDFYFKKDGLWYSALLWL